MDTYYILSIKHSHAGDQYITFWRPNDAGYTLYLPAAGKYTLEQIEANPNYYSNSRATVAVPCHQVDARGVQADEGYDCAGPVVKNHGKIWEALMSHKYRPASRRGSE